MNIEEDKQIYQSYRQNIQQEIMNLHMNSENDRQHNQEEINNIKI